jgi:hypothetical protein
MACVEHLVAWHGSLTLRHLQWAEHDGEASMQAYRLLCCGSFPDATQRRLTRQCTGRSFALLVRSRKHT